MLGGIFVNFPLIILDYRSHQSTNNPNVWHISYLESLVITGFEDVDFDDFVPFKKSPKGVESHIFGHGTKTCRPYM